MYVATTNRAIKPTIINKIGAVIIARSGLLDSWCILYDRSCLDVRCSNCFGCNCRIARIGIPFGRIVATISDFPNNERSNRSDD